MLTCVVTVLLGVGITGFCEVIFLMLCNSLKKGLESYSEGVKKQSPHLLTEVRTLQFERL